MAHFAFLEVDVADIADVSKDDVDFTAKAWSSKKIKNPLEIRRAFGPECVSHKGSPDAGTYTPTHYLWQAMGIHLEAALGAHISLGLDVR